METSVSFKPHVGFEVEKIVGISSDGGYKVQWAPTWVSPYHLIGCEHLIQEFLQQQAEREHRVTIASTEAIVHCDPEFVSEHKDVKISHLTEMGSRSNNAELQANVPVTQNIGAADTVNLHDEVQSVLEEVKVKVPESIGGVEAIEQNNPEPIANESKNGDIDEIIYQEMRTEQMGKIDENVGGHPCVVENADEINQLEIDAKVRLLSHPLDTEIQHFSAEYEERKPDPFGARMENYSEMNQEEQNSSCDEGDCELGNLPYAQHSENLYSSNEFEIGGIDKNIDQEMRSAHMGKFDESVGGMVENNDETNQVSIVMKIEDELLSSPFETDFQDFAAECQESGPDSFAAREGENNETNQEEHNSSCDAGADDSVNVPYNTQHLEEWSSSNATNLSCRAMCSKNSNVTQSDISSNVRERCQPHKLNTFVLNIERLNVQSQKISREESSDSAYCAKENGKHACTTCGKKFYHKKSLWNHQKIHNADNHYVCEKCDASFPTKQRLDRHFLTAHSSLKPYTCNIGGCKKRFAVKEYLTRHLQTTQHSSLKAYTCNIRGCKKRYALKRYLTRHLKTTHSTLKPYTCNVMHCKMRFARKDHCLRHIRRQHKEKILAGRTAVSLSTNANDSSIHNISGSSAPQF